MRSPIEEVERKRLFGGREGLDPETHIFVRYRITPGNGCTREEAAARNLIISTLRTMRPLAYEGLDGRLREAGQITLSDATGTVELAIPISQCSAREGLTHLVLLISSAAEYNYTDTFWIDSIELPRSFIQRHRGPRFGIQGLRMMCGVFGRPIIGLIVKPRNGVAFSAIAKVCEEALRGGADFLVDDLLMVDPDGEMAFESRVPKLASLVRRVSDDVGEKKLYFANVGVAAHKAVEYATKAADAGAHAVMVNAFTMGIGGVEHVIDALNARVAVISTNMGSGLMTRGSLIGTSTTYPTGMAEAVLAKLCRLAGVDAVHTGTSASECYGEDAWGPAYRALIQSLHGIPTSMPVAEGDLTVVNLWENIRSLGRDLLVEPTSGIINYPGGPGKGAAAFRILAETLMPEMTPQAAHAAIQQLASKRNSILKDGLRFFGYDPRGGGKS